MNSHNLSIDEVNYIYRLIHKDNVDKLNNQYTKHVVECMPDKELYFCRTRGRETYAYNWRNLENESKEIYNFLFNKNGCMFYRLPKKYIYTSGCIEPYAFVKNKMKK